MPERQRQFSLYYYKINVIKFKLYTQLKLQKKGRKKERKRVGESHCKIWFVLLLLCLFIMLNIIR